jgi:hypothetical protein
MSSDLLRLILTVAVGAHGIGHTLFLATSLGVPIAGQSSRSWLLSGVVGDFATNGIGVFVWTISTIGFVAAAVGMQTQAEWWRAFAVGSAVISTVGLILFWANPASSPAISALAFDAVVLGVLLWLRWPPTTVVGP